MTDEPLGQPAAPAPSPALSAARSTGETMKSALAIASTALIAVAFLAPMLFKGATVDAELRGAMILQWGGVMGYYFGTSRSSAAKDATIAQITAKGDAQ
jgi:hypothetical protein